MRTDSFLNFIIAPITTIALVAMFIYLGKITESMETIEDQLRYQEPVLNATGQAPAGEDVHYSYVPVYSHVFARGGNPFPLEITLSIRNSDPRQAMTIHAVEYYSGKGQLLQKFVESPIKLPAIQSVEYLVDKEDVAGGAGAAFVVLWSSARSDAEPIIESVMIGSKGGREISLLSTGRLMPFPFHNE